MTARAVNVVCEFGTAARGYKREFPAAIDTIRSPGRYANTTGAEAGSCFYSNAAVAPRDGVFDAG